MNVRERGKTSSLTALFPSLAMALLADVDAFLARRLDVIGRDREELEAEPNANVESGFLRRVLAQPKQWVIGGPDVVRWSAAT